MLQIKDFYKIICFTNFIALALQLIPIMMNLRTEFPVEPGEYEGGTSDGYCFHTCFSGATLEHSLCMVRDFLKEAGYGELPLPANAEELRMFKLPSKKNRQVCMFEDNGYVHNPIKILFSERPNQLKLLRLEIYDENAPNHLLRFHRRLWD